MKGCDGHTLTKRKSKPPTDQTGSQQLTAGRDKGRDYYMTATVRHQQGALTTSSEDGPRPGRKPMTRNRPGPERDNGTGREGSERTVIHVLHVSEKRGGNRNEAEGK